jgi:N-methylhydantoinase A/acetophenone carboxylase
MGFTIDIDTGGTFTDGLFTSGTEIKRVKVDSTPHDLTVSWLNVWKQAPNNADSPVYRIFWSR